MKQHSTRVTEEELRALLAPLPEQRGHVDAAGPMTVPDASAETLVQPFYAPWVRPWGERLH